MAAPAPKMGPIGYGLMTLGFPGLVPHDDDVVALMKTALEAGSNVWNGGFFYGTPERNSLTLLRKYFDKYPEDADKVIINIKGGARPHYQFDGSPEFVTQNVKECVEQLGPKAKIDMWECGRIDKNVPVATSIAAIKKLADDGLIGGVSISECNAASIREAAKVTKLQAVEVELSLFNTTPLENGVAATCHELGIPIHAYSPLGRGFLSGAIQSRDDLPETDMRRQFPRFSEENFPKNLELVRKIEQLAQAKGCLTSQLAINWVRALSERPGMPTVIPIPGSSNAQRIRENAQVVEMTEQDMHDIQRLLDSFTTSGDTYPEMWQKMTQR